MAKPINMPQVGQDLETAIITEWCVQENDRVRKGDIIAVVDSDKASFEVEAFESGTILKLLFAEGEVAEVFKPIAYIGEPGEKLDDIEKDTKAVTPEPIGSDNLKKGENPEEQISKKVLATPAVKRVAREQNIDISTVKGTGPNGRILKEDIFKITTPGTSDKVESATEKTYPSDAVEKDGERIDFTKMRQRIADRLVESKQKIPHFYLFTDVDVTDVLRWRQDKNKDMKDGEKISVNDILIFAVAKALRKFPQMNVHVYQTHLIRKKDINIGLAVSVDGGLIVPVLEKADEGEIQTISKKSGEIIENARKGILKSTALATFTISNLGMYAVDKFIPIINPPEGAILGVGKAEKKVIPGESGTVEVRDILTLTLACDHRAIDGAMGAQFLEELKRNLEGINLSDSI